MKNLRHWALWLGALVLLAGVTVQVQREAHAQTFGGAGNYGLIANGSVDGPIKNIITSTYAIPASEDGFTYTNYGNAGSLVLTLPLTPRLGWSSSFVCDNAASFFVAFNANTGQIIKGTAGSSSSGGNVVTAGGVTVTIKVKYTNTNTYAIMASDGVATTNYTLN